MSQRADPRIVAEVGGLVVAEDGPLVVVIDRGTSPLATLAFVLGVIGLVFGGFGAITLVLAVTGAGPGPPGMIGAVLLAVGLLAAGGAAATVRSIRRSHRKPLAAYRPVAVFDRARRVYVDAGGAVVASLDHVWFQRDLQMMSSAPKLVAVTPHGTRLIKRGNPFNGGLGNLDAVLTEAVHRR